MKNDLYSLLEERSVAQNANRPTKGTIRSINGSRVDVLVRGGSTIVSQVRLVGAAVAIGQEVILSWENGLPTAHAIGGNRGSDALVSISRGPTGPQGPQGPAGTVSAASKITLTELTETPTPPETGKVNLYAREDHKIYKQLPDGSAEELGTGAGSGGPPVFSRVLTAHLSLADTECLVVPGYLDSDTYDVELDGDADIYII